jgi:hypothetical protein
VSTDETPHEEAETPPEPPLLRGLKMTYAERLRWREEAKVAFGRLLGRARGPSRGTPPPEHGG